MINQCVLLIEDNESDEDMAVRSIKRSGLGLEILVARDGEQACEMLAEAPVRVLLIFLDIKLPKKTGFEVLEFIRKQESTKLIPVIMLTSSHEPRDVETALSLGANSYIQKQMDPEISDANIKLALYYWFAVDTTCDKSADTIYRAISA
jgi:two-component system response regulator